jgi:hypothetical protein
VDRKSILDDPSIVWPGTKVEINSSNLAGIVLCSYRHGEVYEVQDSDGFVRVLTKSEFKILDSVQSG